MDGVRAQIAALLREQGRIPPAEQQRLLAVVRDQGHGEPWFWEQVENVLAGDAGLAAKRRLVIATRNRAQLLGTDFEVATEVERARARAESLGWSVGQLRRIFEQLRLEIVAGAGESASALGPEVAEMRAPSTGQRVAIAGLVLALIVVALLVVWPRGPAPDPAQGTADAVTTDGEALRSLLERLEYAASFDAAVDTATMSTIQRIQRDDEASLSERELTALRSTLSAAEPVVWQTVSSQRSIEALERFISVYPDGRFASEASALVDELSEQRERSESISRAQRELIRLGRDIELTGELDEPTRAQLAALRDALDDDSLSGITPELIARLEALRRWPERPGQIFSDCEDCPAMVVVPGGRFVMGTAPASLGVQPSERPAHEVSVPRFALGRTEVTFDQWQACIDDQGCSFLPPDQGWGRGQRPVINVAWADALSYLRWLSRKTGRDYRLPTEAEWEYAARAGTTTPFHTGVCITSEQANFDGRRPISTCPPSDARGRTLPVAWFPANAFGFFDMHGNVREWTRDCWNDSYRGAPTDGSAWMSGDCSRPVIRGGSWRGSELTVRSANRTRPSGSFTDAQTGFRPALSLD